MKKIKLSYFLWLSMAVVIMTGISFAQAQKSFFDLFANHPNYTAIMELQKRGIVSGYPDGSFQPERTVNRVEALKMVILTAKSAQKLKGIALKKGMVTFEDIDRNAWYMPTLEQAVSYDIVSGYPDGFFRPEKTVNLVESLKMALKAFEVALSKISVKENPYADAFAGEWYAKYVEYARRNNLIDADSKNMIYPDQGMKRGTLAEVLYRLLMRFKTGAGVGTTTATSTGAGATTTGTTETGTTTTGTSVTTSTDTTTEIVTTGPIAGALEARVDVLGATTPISPYIYGADEQVIAPPADLLHTSYLKMSKAGLIRASNGHWTTYNWENNAQNRGAGWGPNSSLSIDIEGEASIDTVTPGVAVTRRVTAAHNVGAAALVNVSITDYVAADKDGVVTKLPSDTNKRWASNHATKPGPFLTEPDLKDRAVYQDEFVNFIQKTFQSALTQGKKIFYELDNEPGIWNLEHPLLHPEKTTYAEMADKTKRFGSMIKRIAPDTFVFGMGAFGIGEIMTLNDAPDQDGRVYIDFYLDMIKALEKSEKKRIVDVIDLHWYSQVVVNGRHISDLGSSPDVRARLNQNPSTAEIEARVQNPRSLWDSTYIEDSWITKGGLYEDFHNKPIRLIPWLKEKIAARYPGTKIMIGEYNFGDGVNIAEAVTQADVLGIFGREGVFAAAFFPLSDPFPNSFIQGAFDMYLDYDGRGSAVGDLSVSIKNPDVAKLSLYAMKSSANSNIAHIIAINKTDAEIPFNFKLDGEKYKTTTSYRLNKAGLKPKMASTMALADNILSDRLPPFSVTTFEVRK